jgi:hypothetical protein
MTGDQVEHVIDLSMVQALLTDAQQAVEVLHGARSSDRDAVDNRRQRAALINQMLLRLGDNLTTAGALVRNEYWVHRGHPDPLEES